MTEEDINNSLRRLLLFLVECVRTLPLYNVFDFTLIFLTYLYVTLLFYSCFVAHGGRARYRIPGPQLYKG